MTAMEQRDGFPPGVPCRIDIQQPDRQAALRFYGGLFGWSFEDHMPTGSHSYDIATPRGRPLRGSRDRRAVRHGMDARAVIADPAEATFTASAFRPPGEL